MSTKNLEIEKRMKVHASNGDDLGRISHVWTDVGETPTSPQDYIVVTEGGFLGIGGRSLYIPFDAVASVVPGESVTVNCNQEQCHDLYTTKPEGIKKKEAAIAAAAATGSVTPVIFH
jgi:hypothetical protein